MHPRQKYFEKGCVFPHVAVNKTLNPMPSLWTLIVWNWALLYQRLSKVSQCNLFKCGSLLGLFFITSKPQQLEGVFGRFHYCLAHSSALRMPSVCQHDVWSLVFSGIVKWIWVYMTLNEIIHRIDHRIVADVQSLSWKQKVETTYTPFPRERTSIRVAVLD